MPHKGTRKEFLAELRAAISDSYLYHIWRHGMIRHAIKLHESRKDGVTATEWSDYAAVLDLTRSKTVTCGVPERINELVTVMGYKPRDVTVEVPASRRRAATTKVVRKQQVDVFFAFHGSGYKPDARSYSRCFNFTQLRFCPRGLHTAREAVADARRSPKTAGSCAKWSGIAQARRRCGRFREPHAQRCGAELPGRRESAALSSRFLREGQANHARYLHHLLFTAGCAVYGVQILVLHRRREVCCRGWLSSNPAAHEEWVAALLSRFQRLR